MTPPSPLPPSWEVPQEFRDRLGRQAGRQRAMLSQRHLLLILHRPPDPGEVERTGRFFWRKPDGSWTSSDLGSGPRALARHIDEYAALLEKYDRQEEAATSAADYFAVLDALAPVHRSARHMHETLQQARQMVPQDRDLINFRDRAYETERTVELLCRETKNELDLVIARRAEEQAASGQRMAVSAHRLNLLAAFFFPIATLSAIFGVNLQHGLETVSAPLPFVGILALGLLMGFVLKSFVTENVSSRVCVGTHSDGLRGTGPREPNRVDTGLHDSD